MWRAADGRLRGALSVLGDAVNDLGPGSAQFALETSPVFPRDNIQGDAIPTLAELNRWQGDLHGGGLNFLIFSDDESRIDWILESYSIVPEPDGVFLGLVGAAIASLTRLSGHTNRWRRRP